MPNIELHNFNVESSKLGLVGILESLEASLAITEEIKGKIWAALKGASYYDDAVVTDVYSFSQGPSGSKAAEYLRLWATGQDELDDMLARLEPLDIDIEVVGLLSKFVERRSTRLKREEAASERLSISRGTSNLTSDFDLNG